MEGADSGVLWACRLIATVKDRVMALAAFIDDSGDGLIDEDEILTALLTIGYQVSVGLCLSSCNWLSSVGWAAG